MRKQRVVAVAAIVLAMAACSREKKVDWSAPENFFYYEVSSDVDGGVQLVYWALVDAPADAVYKALADVEHYMQFVDGVDRTQLLSGSGNVKTIQIAQRVIGRQNNAQVRWTLNPEAHKIDFKTEQSDLYYNEGSYEVIASPDDRRTLVKVTFIVKESEHVNIPRGVLASGTRDSFEAAAKSIKKRALVIAVGG
jgi:ribosome-associated toxin RatA of RatAB toxin-antitoxin module